MESYRGNLVQHEPADPAALGSEVGAGGDLGLNGEDDIARQPPPVSVGQDERRMQVRAYNYWASLLGDRPFPRMEDIVPADVPDFAAHAVVLDFSHTVVNPSVVMLGRKLAEECGVATSITQLSDVPGRSLLSRITDHCIEILANEAPIGFEAEFVNQRGKTLLYRSILLPFSSSGDKIQHILGVINWKEVADPLVTAGLRQELEIAIGVEHAQQPVQHLGEWADGPVAFQAEDHGLADWLAVARDSAEMASGLEERSRAALHAAIGRTWDFALAADAYPGVLREVVGKAGLTVTARAPMVQFIELVFGAGYDRVRLADVATVLAHARRLGLKHGALAHFLDQLPGGLKSVVRRERELRRASRQGLRM